LAATNHILTHILAATNENALYDLVIVDDFDGRVFIILISSY